MPRALAPIRGPQIRRVEPSAGGRRSLVRIYFQLGGDGTCASTWGSPKVKSNSVRPRFAGSAVAPSAPFFVRCVGGCVPGAKDLPVQISRRFTTGLSPGQSRWGVGPCRSGGGSERQCSSNNSATRCRCLSACQRSDKRFFDFVADQFRSKFRWPIRRGDESLNLGEPVRCAPPVFGRSVRRLPPFALRIFPSPFTRRGLRYLRPFPILQLFINLSLVFPTLRSLRRPASNSRF